VKQLTSLALHTFQEAVRDRILYSILIFALVLVVGSLAAEQITIGDQAKVVRSFAQSSIDIFASLIAMFLGVSLVYKELDSRTAYTILSRPLPRSRFVLGKYLGLVLTLAVQVAIMVLVYTIVMTLSQGLPPGVVFLSFGLLMFELMLLTAWATLFSCYSGPTTASFFTLAIFTIGHLADDIWTFGSAAESEVVQQTARALYWCLPNFEFFSIRTQAVHGVPVGLDRVVEVMAYGAGYTTVVLAAAVLVFQRRDLK